MRHPKTITNPVATSVLTNLMTGKCSLSRVIFSGELFVRLYAACAGAKFSRPVLSRVIKRVLPSKLSPWDLNRRGAPEMLKITSLSIADPDGFKFRLSVKQQQQLRLAQGGWNDGVAILSRPGTFR